MPPGWIFCSTDGATGTTVADQRELHAADRAIARMILDDLRMHAAGVKLLGLRRMAENRHQRQRAKNQQKKKSQPANWF